MEFIERAERPKPPDHDDERTQLEGWLDFYRATVLVKCAGLDLEQLTARMVPSSALTLLGLVRHMTLVEQIWFEFTFANFAAASYYSLDTNLDADFDNLTSHTLDEVVANFHRACERSRQLSAGHDLSTMATAQRRGREVDLRWIYVHMIEEYARHCGHADLLRELIDGTTGY